MIMLLPNELIDCILDDSLPIKMLSRTFLLLEKALVVPSQRRIFAKIELDGPSSVRLLGFRRFNLDSRLKKEEVYAQIAEGVIQQLPKVETMEFNDIDWRNTVSFTQSDTSLMRLKLPL
ncbi:hypothetical protein BT96DRAFT_1006290 [Gymnopus androsaceus JB14]|uniref:Uncharacterized protein n=1 Tax=Gymnopus androsaceus JB14 TaxID=1447944 RepID=A0A6A4GKR5_9AGAR|nr:hypothetical protein BT96DRAFT_1006290 [Gymnopus androsaceus JB14]